MKDEIRRKAARARALREAGLKAFLEEVRNDQLKAFQNSPKDGQDAREEAHAILRALTAIEQKMSTALAAETRLKNKEDKHGN